MQTWPLVSQGQGHLTSKSGLWVRSDQNPPLLEHSHFLFVELHNWSKSVHIRGLLPTVAPAFLSVGCWEGPGAGQALHLHCELLPFGAG